MYIINLILILCFISHGFCDLFPLIQTFNKTILINYILNIFISCYFHLITPSISTLIFIIISSLHFEEDFVPYNKLKFPGIGLYILSAPIITDYKKYSNYLEYIKVDNIELFLLMMYIGGILGLINSHTKNDSIYHIIIYTFYSLFFGIYAINIYMIYYHLPISICVLCEKYDMYYIFLVLCIGTLKISMLYLFFYDILIEIFINYKDYFIGALFGLLNSHSLINIMWRNNVIMC